MDRHAACGMAWSPPVSGVDRAHCWYAVWSGHVLAPDPHLSLIKAWVFFPPESRDPAVSGPDPTQRGPEPILGVRYVHTRVRHFPMGVRTHCWYLGAYRLLWPRGGPGAIHVVGSSVVYLATRDSRVGTVSSYCSKGYPYFGVPTTSKSERSILPSSLELLQNTCLYAKFMLMILYLVY
jgi:hypothetical protein